MTESLYISRKKPDADLCGFEALKREGIGYIEQLSSDHWTDYNAHDPGITILEQVCYALTELIHRTEFDTADYLTGESGEIDFEQLGLFEPELVFPCRPTTINDYRKIFIDNIHEIDNVWIKDTQKELQNGEVILSLYQIIVRISENQIESNQQTVLNKILAVYNENRNIGEDVEDILVVRNKYCELCASVDIEHSKNPALVLAKIFHACEQELATAISLHSFDKKLLSQHSLEELFTGPCTSHGFLDENDLTKDFLDIPVSKFHSIVRDIEGVNQVNNLCFYVDGEQVDSSLENLPFLYQYSLYIPNIHESVNNIRVKLLVNGKQIKVAMAEFLARYNEISQGFQSLRQMQQDVSFLYNKPVGQYRKYSDYSSIQHHFPNTYGINEFGVPDSATPIEKARTKQLKSYLVFFEQIMANYAENIDNLIELFSLNSKDKTYSVYNLNKSIKNLQGIYPEDIFSKLNAILKTFDNHIERQNRLLNYMLALYGEKYPQNTLTQLAYYYSPEEIKKKTLNLKLDYLRSIVEITKNRGAAPNYNGVSSRNYKNISGLKHKISLSLGFKTDHERFLTTGIHRQGYKLVSHAEYIKFYKDNMEIRLIEIDDVNRNEDETFEDISVNGFGKELSVASLREQVEDIALLKNNIMSNAMLTDGVNIDNYKVGSLTSKDGFQIIFKPKSEIHWWYLNTYQNKEAAVNTINALRRLILNLNIDSEGLHIIEHIMLRPRINNPLLNLKNEGFYNFQISVLFPEWTVRCQDKHFQRTAEELVLNNSPAHIYPHIFWLQFDEMLEFESLYKQWMDCKSEENAVHQLDQLSNQLVEFLSDLAIKNNCKH